MSVLGLFVAVHDEEEWIEAFLDHHRAVGVEQAFVYLDRCSDRTGERADSYPWVTTIEWDRPAECRWLSDYQALVAVDAVRRAEEAGLDWLAFLDVDEFAWAGPVGSTALEVGHLGHALAQVDPTVEVARLATVEMIPRLSDKEQTARRPWAAVYVQPEGRLARQMLDPCRDEVVILPGNIGHSRGKTVARVRSGLRLVDPHRWQRADGSAPSEVDIGHHLHLVVADSGHWRTKYRKLTEPQHWPNGEPVPFPKAAFIEASATMTAEDARAYFDEWVAVSDRELTRGLIQGTVKRWPLLRSTLAEAGHEPLMAELAERTSVGEWPVTPTAVDGTDSQAGTSPSPAAARVAFIGLDAFDIEIARPWAEEGRLPVLADLLARGRLTPTEAPPGIFTGAVWATIWTGRHAGHHGYHCWEQLRPGTYDFETYQVGETGLGVDPLWVDLGRTGRTSVLIDAPHTQVVPGLPGIQVLEWGGHDAIAPPISEPPEVIDLLNDRYGDHPSWGNCNQHDRRAADHIAFRDRMVEGTESKADLTIDLYRRVQPDLLVSVFGEAHCIGHQAWHVHDPEAPDHRAELTAEVGDPVFEVYRAVDAALGRVLDEVPPDTALFVLCSHGMGTHTDPTFLVDDLLLRLDASLRFQRSRRVLQRLQQAEERCRQVARAHARWSLRGLVGRSAARLLALGSHLVGRWHHERSFRWSAAATLADRRWFQHPNNEPEAGIRLNEVGREPDGIIEPAAVDAEIDWLVTELHALRDADGEPVVRDVLLSRDLYDGPYLDVLPDLLVRWHRRPRMADRITSPRVGEVHRPYQGARTGDHHPRGLLIRLGGDVTPGEDEAVLPVDRIASLVTAALDRSVTVGRG